MLGVVVGAWLFFGRIGAWAVRAKVLPRIEQRLGARVVVGGIDVDGDRVVLTAVSIQGPGGDRDRDTVDESDSDGEAAGGQPLIKVARVTAPYEFWPTVRGNPTIGEVTLEQLEIAARRGADGSWNFSQLLARVRSSGGPPAVPAAEPSAGTSKGLRPARVQVRGGRLSVVDSLTRATLSGALESIDLTRGEPAHIELADVEVDSGFGPRAGFATVSVSGQLRQLSETLNVEVGAGYVDLWRGMSLTGIAGTVRPIGESGRVAIDLAGGYGGVEGTLWTARGWVAPRTLSGSVDLEADRFTFDRLRPVLEGTPVVDFDQTSVDVAVRLRLDRGNAQFEGTANLSGLNVFHAALADEPVRDLGFVADLSGGYDRESRTFSVAKARVQYRDVRAEADAFFRLPGGVDPQTWARRTEPRVGLHVVVPSVPCQRALAALPRELTPKLQGFRLRGNFAADINLDIDWADLEATELDGKIDIFRCKVRQPGTEIDAADLLTSFQHKVLVAPDTYEKMTIGESNPTFAYLAEVSPHLINAHLTTEDSRFMSHRGFIGKEFRSALVRNLSEGYFKFGASSITMQTVKNIWLHRDKLLSRKLQELFLSWYIETQLDKERILEIYVNAIEYGPGIYGIGAAARYYFGKAADDITVREAVFLTSMLPSPRTRHDQYCRNELTRKTERKIERVLDIMVERDRLTPEERELVRDEPLRFVYSRGFDPGECADKIAPWEDARIAELEAEGRTDEAAELRTKQRKRRWWYKRESGRLLTQAAQQRVPTPGPASLEAAAAAAEAQGEDRALTAPLEPPLVPTLEPSLDL